MQKVCLQIDKKTQLDAINVCDVNNGTVTMDQKQRSESCHQTKYTRATARHLRRKKLKEARKAEKQLVESMNDIQNTNQEIDDKLGNDKSAFLILGTHDVSKRNTIIKENEINLSTTTSGNDTEVPKIKILPTITELISKAESIQEQVNVHVNITKSKDSSEEIHLIEQTRTSAEHSLSSGAEESTSTRNLPPVKSVAKMTDNNVTCPEKTREQVKAEREAKKAAKAAAKSKNKEGKEDQKENTPKTTTSVSNHAGKVDTNEKHEPKKSNIIGNIDNSNIVQKTTSVGDGPPDVKSEGKSKAELRAERRAKQEAQRAAKQGAQRAKQELTIDKTIDKTKQNSKDSSKIVQIPVASRSEPIEKVTKKSVVADKHEVSLFKHLYHETEHALLNVPSVNSRIHPAVVKLGVQYTNKIIVGGNARCVALLVAVKHLVQDFERPSNSDFVRGLEAALQDSAEYLHHCRPLAVSMRNALRHLKWQMTKLSSSVSDQDAKEQLGIAIDTYIREQIDLAGEAISATIQSKISNGNVILTYGYSSLIHKIFLDAHKKGKQFRVVIVDARPWLEGKEQLRRLAKCGIDCSYILINALSFIMPEVSKVFLGAHAILANGAVMSRVGTAQVALMARAFNVPVLVACEMHKSSERVQTDSIVYNELGNADELVYNPYTSKKSILVNWRTKKCLNLLNITYDVTPADLVTAVVTELAILPCTSVPVILRIKPSEI